MALKKAATIFISYLTATANDVASSEKRKTINTKDVLQSLNVLEFDSFVPILEENLAAHLEEKEKKKEKKIKLGDQNEEMSVETHE